MNPKFEKRHYIEIANLLDEQIDISSYGNGMISTEDLITAFICLFNLDNPNFSEDRFRNYLNDLRQKHLR